MLPRTQDPIIAIATAPGRGAVGIVRLSGADLRPLLAPLLGRSSLPPRTACYGPFLDADGAVIDHGLALHFPAPASATGEDVLELQAHGGPVVLQMLVARCLQAAAQALQGRPCLPGLRLAEPGEFTQRAYLNHKLDLAQAEAVADLIDASTEAAARSASRALGGAFSQAVERLREALVQQRVMVEAALDFPEEPIDVAGQQQLARQLQAVSARLAEVLAQARQGVLLREGLQVVIAGQPNVGKSSLLNRLAGAELAIVTPWAGTTRDRIAQTLQVEGVPLHLVDTAGLRSPEQAADAVERIGIERSWQAIAEADLVLFVHDLSRWHDAGHRAADAAIEARLPNTVPWLHVANKVDVAAGVPTPPWPDAVALSALTGEGIDALRRRLLAQAGWQALPEGVFIARSRHLKALQDAAQHLAQADAWVAEGESALELLAEELRLAHQALGRITGAVLADDLLGEIFSRFCIGK